MNEIFLKLAGENFYASPDAVRNFFMLATKDPKAFFEQKQEPANVISNYGTEYNTIFVKGMMVRERSWITDLGFGTSTEQVIDAIKETLAEDKKVKLIINTGGGQVSGTSNLADLIYENRENIEAYATGVVASAGMWIYSSAGKRYAESTTVMGSIGVVTSVFDDEEYWKSYGIIWKEVVSANAKNKRPDVKTEEGQGEIQRYLTSLESVFLESVSKSLDMSRDDVISKFNQGGLVTGKDAFDMGIIESLTTYDSVATMPSKQSADEKIAISNNGSDVMNITQEKFDAVQRQLDEATASITTLNAEKGELQASLDKANSDFDAFKKDVDVRASTIAEIVAMAFENNVSKETAVKMVACTTKADAGLLVLKQNNSVEGTVEGGDVEEGASADADEEAEAEYAMAIAKKLSVNKK